MTATSSHALSYLPEIINCSLTKNTGKRDYYVKHLDTVDTGRSNFSKKNVSNALITIT